MVDKIFRSKRKDDDRIILVALDFKKAFDSIDRKRMIEVLIKYKIHPYIIDLIAKVYSNDKTIVKTGKKEEEIRVTAGIKQGCTASTVLFRTLLHTRPVAVAGNVSYLRRKCCDVI